MNKNNIILIGIVLLFLLVIRPMSKKNKGTEEAPKEQANTDAETLDAEITEINYTQYAHSPYVSTSLQNAHNTVAEGVELQGKTYTL